RWLIVLDRGQKLVQTLTEQVQEKNILGGTIVGIGAIKDVELGFYHLEDKYYERRKFEAGDYELISLNGNISLRDDHPYVHVHTAIGDKTFQVFGGHLFEATIAVTAEIYVIPFGSMPEREDQFDLGLATITRCPI